MNSNPTLKILVGALVVAVAVAAFVLSQRGDHHKVENGYDLLASFGAIDGVEPGTKVLLTGLPVGEVDKFYYNEKRQRAIVTLSIRDGIEIPLDSVVMIVTDGLLGGKYLKIQAGGDTEMMKPGDQFDYTQDSIVFEEILEKVILNAEEKRRKENEERAKEKKDGKPAKNPNEASLSDDLIRFAQGQLREARMNQ